MSKRSICCLVVVVALLGIVAPASAEETKGKFRFSPRLGYVTVSDEIRSNSTNAAAFEQPDGTLVFADDPRNDRGAEQSASIPDGVAYGFTVDYGLMKWKWGELSIAGDYTRFESTVSDLEVQGQFYLEDPLDSPSPPHPLSDILYPACGKKPGRSCWALYRIGMGDIEWDNPQIGVNVRFRPTKMLSPYVGAGVGYYMINFTQDSMIDELSNNLAHTNGSYAVYDPETYEQKMVIRPGMVDTNGDGTLDKFKGFGPIEITADDAFEYHLRGGLDLSVNKWLTVYFDSSFQWTDGQVRITADGREELGQSWPDSDEPLPNKISGMVLAVQVPSHRQGGVGGLMDVGSAFQNPDNPTELKRGPKDGQLDAGQFYIQGGTIKYGGYIFNLGVRFTF